MQKSKADYALLETMLQAQQSQPPPDIMTSSHSSTSRSPVMRRPSFFIPGINGKARCCEKDPSTITSSSREEESMMVDTSEGSRSSTSLIGLQLRASTTAEADRVRHRHSKKKKKKEREPHHRSSKDNKLPATSSSSRRKKSGEGRHRRRDTDEEKRTRRERGRNEEERRKTRRRRKRFEESRTNQSTRSIDDLDLVDSAEERRRKELLGSPSLEDSPVEDSTDTTEQTKSSAPDLDIQDIGYQSEEVLGTLRDRRHNSVGSLGNLFRSESPITEELDTESLTQNLHDSILQSLGCPRTPSSSRQLVGSTSDSLNFSALDDAIASATRSPRGHKSMASLLHSSLGGGEDSQSSLDFDELGEMGPMERLYTSMMAPELNKSCTSSSTMAICSTDTALMHKLSQSEPTITAEVKALRRAYSSDLPPLPVLGESSKKKSRSSKHSSSTKSGSSSSKRSSSTHTREHRHHRSSSKSSPSRRTRTSSRSKRSQTTEDEDLDVSTSKTTKTSSTSIASTTGTHSKRSSRRTCGV